MGRCSVEAGAPELMADSTTGRRAGSTAPKSKRPSGGARGRHRAEPTRRSGVRLLTRLVGPVVLLVITVVIVLFVLFPTRTWLGQRQTLASSQQRLDDLRDANAAAQARVDALDTDTEVERIAREQYGYAKAGEEVYHVLPPARDPIRVPDAWPFNGLGSTLQR